MNKRKEIIPNNLKDYRKKHGFKQKEVAKLLGFESQERISHWEKGNNVPSLEYLFMLSCLYATSPMELYPNAFDAAVAHIRLNLQSTKLQNVELCG
jgi:transcriptional regulator with XRE-family HTH domain